MLNIIMLSVTKSNCYAERRCAERLHAERHYAECHYAECRYAECHGTLTKALSSLNIKKVCLVFLRLQH